MGRGVGADFGEQLSLVPPASRFSASDLQGLRERAEQLVLTAGEEVTLRVGCEQMLEICEGEERRRVRSVQRQLGRCSTYTVRGAELVRMIDRHQGVA